MKAICFFITILSGITLNAQTTLPAQAFYGYENICHVSGGTYKDFVLLLYPDSVVAFDQYIQKTGNFLKRNQRNEFRQTGRYSMVGDTLTVYYKPVLNSETRSGISYIDSLYSLISSRHSTKRFLWNRNDGVLQPLDNSLPRLELTSLARLHQQLAAKNRGPLTSDGLNRHRERN